MLHVFSWFPYFLLSGKDSEQGSDGITTDYSLQAGLLWGTEVPTKYFVGWTVEFESFLLYTS